MIFTVLEFKFDLTFDRTIFCPSQIIAELQIIPRIVQLQLIFLTVMIIMTSTLGAEHHCGTPVALEEQLESEGMYRMTHLLNRINSLVACHAFVLSTRKM